MPVEVACPGCGSRLRAPDDRVGKKAKCKKCATSFRIPGPATLPDSVGESQLLSAINLPGLPGPGGDDGVPMASPVEESEVPLLDPTLTPPARTPAPAPARPTRQAKETAKKPPQTPPPVKRAEQPVAREADPFATPFAHAPETVALDEPFAFQEPKASPKKAKTPKADRDEKPAEKPKKPSTEPQNQLRENPVTLPEMEDSPGEASFADPFTFSADATRAREDSRSRGQQQPRDDEASEEQDSRRHLRPQKKSNTLLLLAGAIALMALGGGITALVVLMRKDPEVAKKSTEKKEEPAPAPTEPAPKDDAKAAKIDTPTKDKKKDATRKDSTGPPSRNPKPPGDPPATSLPMLSLPEKLKTYSFGPPSAKPESLQTPTQEAMPVPIAFNSVKRFFPSANRAVNDVVVVWQSAAGFNGAGERLSVDSYSAITGILLAHFEIDGDGKDLKCDISADGRIFAAAANGKINLWELSSKSRVLEDFDPYADKPMHKKAGLAAVFMVKNPNNMGATNPSSFVTVSTAGAIHLFDLATRKLLAEYTPENGVAGRVAFGKSVAVDEGHELLVVAVGGAIHQVKLLDLTLTGKLDLKGEVGRSLGIAVQGMTGRISYAFETDADGKKERAILFCLARSNPALFRWQDSAGEPVSITWSGDFIVVGAAEGVVWFEYNTETRVFLPLAVGKTPSGKGLHSATERAHWYLIPNPGKPAESLVVELATPIQDSTDFSNMAAEGKRLETLRLDNKGLWK